MFSRDAVKAEAKVDDSPRAAITHPFTLEMMPGKRRFHDATPLRK
jgi:hypothetical protein